MAIRQLWCVASVIACLGTSACVGDEATETPPTTATETTATETPPTTATETTATETPPTTVTNYIDAYAAVDQDDGIVTDGDLVVIRANLATSDLDSSRFSDSQIRTIVGQACDVIRGADDLVEFRTATLQLWADKSEEEYFHMMSIAGHGMWTACNGEAVRAGLWD